MDTALQRARLAQREDPFVVAREIGDVPEAGQRLRVRRQALAQARDPVAQDLDPIVCVLDLHAQLAPLPRQRLHFLLALEDLLLARLDGVRIPFLASLDHRFELLVQADHARSRLLAGSRSLALALQGVVEPLLLDLQLHLEGVDRRQLLLRTLEVLSPPRGVRQEEEAGDAGDPDADGGPGA